MTKKPLPEIRVTAICFKAGKIGHFDDFAEHVARLSRQAVEQAPDLILFPELITFELLDLVDSPDEPEDVDGDGKLNEEERAAAKKALDAIKAVEAVLISGESINIALTLKNLKDSVEELPTVMKERI